MGQHKLSDGRDFFPISVIFDVTFFVEYYLGLDFVEQIHLQFFLLHKKQQFRLSN